MARETVLYRDRGDAVVAGVCAALARVWGVDRTLVRVGFVIVSILTGGFAIAAYLALWALLPEAGSTTEPVRRLLPFTASWSSSALVTAVVLAALVLGLLVTRDAGGLVILLLAWLILRFAFSRRRRHRVPPPVGGPTPPAPAGAPGSDFDRLSAVWQQRVDNVQAGRPPDWVPPTWLAEPDPMGLYSPAPAPPAPARNPARRRAGARTWFWIVVASGVVWSALGALPWVGVSVPPLAWAAATLGVLGLALVVVARPARAAYGRPPALIFAAVVAALATGVLMAGRHVDLTPPVQVANVVTFAGASLPESRAFEAGEHTADLTDVAIAADADLQLVQDVGTLRVIVPAEGNVVVRYAVGAGETVAPDQSLSGFDTSAVWERIDDRDGPTLTIVATLDFGRLEVVEP